MSTTERDERLVAMVKEYLDAGVDTLDGRTTARLREARLKAMETAQGRRGWFHGPRWVAVGGGTVAAAAVLAVGVWLSDSPRESAVATADDIEIVAAQDQMQLYEDLEFYRWLATQENGG